MKLFVWEWEGEYRGGIVCVIAKSVKEAREKALTDIHPTSILADFVKHNEPVVKTGGAAHLTWYG